MTRPDHPTMRDVTEAELRAFVAGYPRPLAIDVTGISEPPTKSWNDFTRGPWPASVVAACALDDDMGRQPVRWARCRVAVD